MNLTTYLENKKKSKAAIQLTLLFFSLFLCLMFPYFGFVLLSLFVYFADKPFAIRFYLIYTAVFLGLLGSLKFPVSDLKNYIFLFEEYGSLPISDFFEFVYKDHLYFYINRMIFELGLNGEKFFTFFWVFSFYAIMLFSLYLLFINKYLDKQVLVIVSLFFAFSSEFLVLSSHLIRQFVASAILIFFIASSIVKKKSYIAFFSFGFVHFSSLFFAFLYPLCRKKLNVTTFVIILAALFIFFNQQFYSRAFSFFGIPVIDIVFHRLNEAGTVTTNDGAKSFKMYIISSFFLISLFYLIYFRGRHDYAILFNMMLSSFMLVLVTHDIPQVSLRFSFYQYPFYIIALAIILSECKISSFPKLMLLIFMVLYSIRQFLFFENSFWSSMLFKEQLMLKNIFFLFGID